MENCKILQPAYRVFPVSFDCQRCKSVAVDTNIWQLYYNLSRSLWGFSVKYIIKCERDAAVGAESTFYKSFFLPSSLKNEYSRCKTVSRSQSFLNYQEGTLPVDIMNTLGTVLRSREKKRSYHQLWTLHLREESRSWTKSFHLRHSANRTSSIRAFLFPFFAAAAYPCKRGDETISTKRRKICVIWLLVQDIQPIIDKNNYHP